MHGIFGDMNFGRFFGATPTHLFTTAGSYNIQNLTTAHSAGAALLQQNFPECNTGGYNKTKEANFTILDQPRMSHASSRI